MIAQPQARRWLPNNKAATNGFFLKSGPGNSQGADQLRTLQRRSALQDEGRATVRLQSYLHGSVGLVQREFPTLQGRSGTLTVQVLPLAVVQMQ